jgi:hypothetical protein
MTFSIKSMGKNFLIAILFIFLFEDNVFALSDIRVQRYYFQPEAVQYQKRRLYVIFENSSSTLDFYGSASIVCTSSDGKKLFYGVSQILSIFKSSTDGVFFDDEVFFAGDFECDFEVKDIKGATVIDEAKKLNADPDTDRDGKGNKEDDDDDADGLSDVEETRLGTNSLLADTDGDGVMDKLDVFPKDKSKTINIINTNLSASKPIDIGLSGKKILDNLTSLLPGKGVEDKITQIDTDKDGLTDKDEIAAYKTSPVNVDTDSDGLDDRVDNFKTDKTNGAMDDDKDGLISQLEKKYHLNPYHENTYIIKDYYSYFIIRYFWIILFIFFILFIYRKYRKYKYNKYLYKKRRQDYINKQEAVTSEKKSGVEAGSGRSMN